MNFSELVTDNGLFCDGDWIEKKDQDPNGSVRLIQLADIGIGEFKDKSERYITEDKARELNCTYLHKGDILIARLPDPLGRACLFPLEGKFITAVDVAVVRIDRPNINTKYVMYMINSPEFRYEVKKYESGTTRKRISRKNLNKIQFSIPPLPEQERIVTRIEELFSQLDNGVETLQTIKKQLAVYRQAVLKEAFEGKYTDDTFHENKRICDFANVGTGATPLTSKKEYYSGDIPWVTSSKINENHIYTPTDYITELAINETNCKIFPAHTLLVAMYGEGKTRGKCAELMIPAATNQALAAIELHENAKVYQPYLKWFFVFNYQQIRRKASGGVQPNLNLGIVKNISVPIYGYESQKRIVNEIESRLSVCDSIEQTVDTALQQAEALRQSILKEAFEGRLI